MKLKMDEIISIVSDTLKNEKDIIALFLFGSRAIGGEKKTSDYDFFVVLDKNTKDSLREDELSQLVFEKTKNKAIVHLTFQYLYVLDEDKSLLLKISQEGKLIFSKALLLGSYEQAGLQRFFLCTWQIDENRFLTNKEKGIKTSKQIINRIFNGYSQKYTYKSEKKVSKFKGLADNSGIFFTKDTLIIIDLVFDHVKAIIEKHNGKLFIQSELYIPKEKIKNFEKYRLKKEFEVLLGKELKKNIFVFSYSVFDHDKVHIKYYPERNLVGLKSIIIKLKELPDQIYKQLLSCNNFEFS